MSATKTRWARYSELDADARADLRAFLSRCSVADEVSETWLNNRRFAMKPRESDGVEAWHWRGWEIGSD